MSEAEMREEIQKMLAEADRATLDELRVFIEYYLGGGRMSVKITISYEKPEELRSALRQLSPVIKRCKLPKGQQGKYKTAYVLLKDDVASERPQNDEMQRSLATATKQDE